MPNPLAMRLRMSPEIEAAQPGYGYNPPTDPRALEAYYPALQALMAMQHGQRPATDMENQTNMDRFAAARGPEGLGMSEMRMRPQPGAERMWEYAGGVPEPGGLGEGWQPVQEFIAEAAKFRDQLPEPLRLRLDMLKGGR